MGIKQKKADTIQEFLYITRMKTRVLFLIESLSGGGAEKVLSLILSDIDKERFECNVCPIVDTGVYREEVKASTTHYSPIISYDGVAVSRFINRLKYKLVYSLLPLSWVYRFFVPKGNDVEIAFCEGYVTKLLSQSGSNAKKIAWVHTDLAANPWPLQQSVFSGDEEVRQSYHCYDRVVCVSNSVENVMRKEYGLSNTTVIPNPVDVEAITSLANVDCPHDIDTSCFNIVAVGRLVPQKGFDELIRIVAKMRSNHARVHLYIVGEGNERSRLEKMIAAFNAEEYIHLTGFMTNPYALMAHADLYVCSSRAEGFSLTVAEAMVLGLPILSTGCVGPAELLEQGRYGGICDSYDELYEALTEAYSDKDFLEDLRRKSMGGKTRFDKNKVFRQIEFLLETVS